MTRFGDETMTFPAQDRVSQNKDRTAAQAAPRAPALRADARPAGAMCGNSGRGSRAQCDRDEVAEDDSSCAASSASPTASAVAEGEITVKAPVSSGAIDGRRVIRQAA